MRSHLISKVVLKQFANDKRETFLHLSSCECVELKNIDNVACIDIDEALIGELEKKWSCDVEDNAERAINALKNNNLNTVSKHIDTIKSLLSLNFVRSIVFYLIELNEKSIDNRFQKIKEDFIAAYPERKEKIDEVVNAKRQTVNHEIAVLTMENWIPKVEDYMKDSDIGFEVGEAPEGESFILGDAPVITADGKGNFGVFNGVPLTEVKSIGMPVTPKYLVTLKKSPTTPKYTLLSKGQVKTANSRQLTQMVKEYYSKP